MLDTFLFACGAVLPIVLLIVLGYLLKRARMLGEPLLSGLNRVCFRVLIPLMLFRNIYGGDSITPTDVQAVLFSTVAILAVFAAGWVLVRVAVKQPLQKGVLLQAVFRSNFAIIGLPLATTLFGEAGARTAALLSMVTIPLFNVLAVISLSVFVGDGAKKPSAREVLHNIITNPLILGVLAGVLVLALRALFARLGWAFRLTDIPGLYDAIDMAASAATPLALLVLGGQFELSAVRQLARPIVLGSVMRLVVVPAAALLAAYALFPGFGGAEYASFVALFGTPTAVSGAVMASEMGGDGELAGQLVVWTTLGSAFTLFFFIALLRAVGIF